MTNFRCQVRTNMGCGGSTEQKPTSGGSTKAPAAAVANNTAAPAAPATDIPEEKRQSSAAKKSTGNRKTAPKAEKDGGGKRRLAVTTDYQEDDENEEDFKFTPVEKSDEDKEKIREALGSSFLFKTLEENLLKDIIDAMDCVQISAGQTVIKQGDNGDYFYVIKTGSYEVFLKTQEAPVVTMEFPAVFGELALMYGSPRAATIKAAEDGSVWRVERGVFRGIVLNSPVSKLVRFIRGVPVLQKCTEKEITDIAMKLENESYKEGEIVASFPDKFYIVREGTVSVQKKREKDTEEVQRLQSKDFFGDRELISGQGGETYVAAKGGCKVLCFSKKDFQAAYPSLSEPLNDYLKLNTLRNIQILKDVSESQLEEVVDSFKTETYTKGMNIITQGKVGHRFYILQKGTVTVRVDGTDVASLGSYSFFGERSLLNDDLTAADIIADSDDVTVLSLERDSFDVLLGPLKEIIAKQNKIRMLKKVGILKPLSDAELEALSDALLVVTYNDGEAIILEGSKGHTFFMLKSGTVKVWKDDNPDKELVRLQKGTFFGEKALLDDEPRAANITAVGQVECFTIDRADFDKHLGSLRDIMNVHAQKLQRQKVEKGIRFEDLQEVATLGSGAFGLVSLVKDKKSNTTFALKAINKKYVQKTRTQAQLRREVLVLGEVDNPFLMHLVKTFRDARRVYFLIEPLLGGELFSHLADVNNFTEDRARFYAACVLMGLSCLHEKGIIYRDLKLENLLLDRKGYVKIVDFGFAKKLKQNELTYTLCGTPDYLAPEVLRGTGHGKGADYWSLGVLIYEMIMGYTPFGADDDSEICRNILSGMIDFEDGRITKEAKDLIRKLLNRDPRGRLGCGKSGVKALMQHPWFSKIDWIKLGKQQIPAPFTPDVEDEYDVSNFDEVDDSSMHTEDSEPCEDKMLDAVFGADF